MRKHNLTIIALLIVLVLSCGNSAEHHPVKEKETTKSLPEETKIELVTNDDRKELEPDQEIMIEEQTKNEENVADAIKPSEELSGKDNLSTIAPTRENEKQEAEEATTEQVKAEVYLVKANHDDWNELTQKHVSANGVVNYKGMKADMGKITRYLQHLETTIVDEQWSKNEKLAYWINLYNAATVYLIVSNYPVKSITNISGGKPWDKRFVKANGKTLTLNEIENKIVRPQFKEPRIHAALNCAALSCPKLLNEAYDAKKLDAQLTKQTRAWINDPTKNELTPTKVKLSQIFEWYRDDFKAAGGVIKFISKYSNKKFTIDPKAKISYLQYNWTLNE